jgi:hypothetical protein
MLPFMFIVVTLTGVLSGMVSSSRGGSFRTGFLIGCIAAFLFVGLFMVCLMSIPTV